MNKIIDWIKSVVCKNGNHTEEKEQDDSVTKRNAKSVTQDMLKRVARINEKMETIVDNMDCSSGGANNG